MHGVGNACHREDALWDSSSGLPTIDDHRASRTSVDPGNMDSLALSRAPLASWISLILLPALPMLQGTPQSARPPRGLPHSPEFPTHTLPIRELGMINLIVTAREPGSEGWSNGSSLIRRTIRPKA